jgi:hypothetical protein
MTDPRAREGTYRGRSYRIGLRDPLPGVGWTILGRTRREPPQTCSGAFYDDMRPCAPNYTPIPSADAYELAERGVRLEIDRLEDEFTEFLGD